MNRKDLILKLIVEHFVKTAEPVSSQVLIDIYQLDVSSATIRNEMKDLEEEGFIEKPHTSAGRVPSTKGYNYYVEHLRTHRLDNDIKYRLQQVFDHRHLNIEEVITEGCKILSEMTNLTVVMLGKSAAQDVLKDIQIVQISSSSAMCLYVLESGEVATKKFSIPGKVSLEELKSCIRIFNERLAGSSITDVLTKIEAIKPLVADYVESYEVLLKTFLGAMINLTSEKMTVFGASNLFNQVEFSNDINRLKKMMELLENSSIWSALDGKQEKLQISIGKDDLEIDDISIVKAEIKEISKSVALVGPTRMDYDRIIEAFNYLQYRIEQLLEKGKKNV